MADSEHVVRAAAEHLSQGMEGAGQFVENVSGWSESLDVASYTGLLPMAVTMMILHEMYFSTSENRAPRVGWMLLRIVGFGACLVGYDRIVGLLTGLVGGASAWPDIDDLLAPLEYGLKTNMKLVGMTRIYNLGDTLGPFMIWAILFLIDCLTALFAVIVITVLVKIQALLLVIFIASGKTCLILSIVPGVGIGKSWAKAVATVAAWGAMGGIVFSAVGFSGARFSTYAASSVVLAHFQIWLAYALIGIFAMSIPKLVSALVSGSMSAAPGLGAALGGSIIAARFMQSRGQGLVSRISSMRRQDREREPGNGAGRAGKVSRGHSGSAGGYANSNSASKRSYERTGRSVSTPIAKARGASTAKVEGKSKVEGRPNTPGGGQSPNTPNGEKHGSPVASASEEERRTSVVQSSEPSASRPGQVPASPSGPQRDADVESADGGASAARPKVDSGNSSRTAVQEGLRGSGKAEMPGNVSSSPREQSGEARAPSPSAQASKAKQEQPRGHTLGGNAQGVQPSGGERKQSAAVTNHGTNKSSLTSGNGRKQKKARRGGKQDRS